VELRPLVPLFLLSLALSACEPPTAGREVEVPLRLYHESGRVCEEER